MARGVAVGVARAAGAVWRFERMAWGMGAAERLAPSQPLISSQHLANEPPPVTAAGGDRALAYCMKYPRGEQF